jgi:hypothetical protein
MLVRLARAYRVRPSDLLAWDYWREYVPAIENLLETPLIDETVAALFRGKSGGSQTGNHSPVSKKDRAAAFEGLKRKAEKRREQ